MFSNKLCGGDLVNMIKECFMICFIRRDLNDTLVKFYVLYINCLNYNIFFLIYIDILYKIVFHSKINYATSCPQNFIYWDILEHI